MLILSRRINERIMIGDDVTLEILSIRGNQVRLGIDAPDDVIILREELYHKTKSNNDKYENKGSN